MRKEVLFVLFLLWSFVVYGYVPEERLFGATESVARILSIRGAENFYRDVVQNKKPVVAKIVTGIEDSVSQSIYREVADQFGDGVVFARMKISDVMKIVRVIMTRLGIAQVALPLFLFFKQGALILPLVAGSLTKDRLIEHIKKKFFNKLSYSVLRLQKISKEKEKKEPATETTKWKKLDNLGDKLKSWLLSLQDVSREVKAYQLAQARKRRKIF